MLDVILRISAPSNLVRIKHVLHYWILFSKWIFVKETINNIGSNYSCRWFWYTS